MTASVLKVIDDWGKIISYFDGVLEEELEYVSRETAGVWHQKLQEYFSQPPDLKSVTRFLEHLTLTEEQKSEALRLFRKLKENREVRRTLSQVYDQLFAD